MTTHFAKINRIWPHNLPFWADAVPHNVPNYTAPKRCLCCLQASNQGESTGYTSKLHRALETQIYLLYIHNVI